ncbi:MAG: exo-alpha-sialidase [Gammaproteobacteria bacterium]|nr:exo-alpha-sialidase [Gammaproteobacteria bacterium]
MAITDPVSRNLAVALSALLLAAGAWACDDAVSIHCGSTPSSVLTEDGELLAVFVSDDHVYFTRAERETLAFSPPVRVSREPARIDHNGESRPKLALGRDRAVFVTWTRRIEGRFAGDVYFSRSLDGGESFETPRLMRDTPEPTSHRFDALTVTPSGRLYVAWIDKRELAAAEARGQEDFAGASIHFAVSDDDGTTFGPNRRAATHSCECCRLAMVAADADRARLLWRHVFEGSIRDHALAELAPDGASELKRISHEDWMLEGCPHEGPHMAAGASGDHMVWFSGAPDAGGVHYGFWDHATGTTRHLKHIDDRPGSGKPQVAVRGDHVDLVWLAVGAEHSEVLHLHSHDGGRSWSEPRTLATSAATVDHPRLLAAAEAVWLAWHTRDEGYRLLSLSDPGFERP